MPSALRRLREHYGADPLHLLALLGCFALAGYAALRTVHGSGWPLMLLWFAGAVIAHDVVLFPLYALADRSLSVATWTLRAARDTGPPLVPALNHVRLPALGTALLFLVFFPGIVRQGHDTYLAATGQTQQPFLGRWLLLTAAMFALSAVTYAVRLGHARRRAGNGAGQDPERSGTGSSRQDRHSAA